MLKPLRFQHDFMDSAAAPGVEVAAASWPRANGKSWTGAALLARSLTPGDGLFVPNAENLLVSGSIEQSRTVYRFIRSMLGEANYRYLDSAPRLGITHTPSLTRLRVLSSDSKRALGIVGARLVIADEPGSWDSARGELMFDYLSTALGKNMMTLVFLGTLAPAVEGSWWPALVAGGSAPGTHVSLIAGDRGTWDEWPTIRRANPMVNVNPLLRRRLIRERDDARSDERLKSRFLSMRLNVPSRGDDVALLTVEDWLTVVSRKPPEPFGRPVCGVDIGANRSWSAAVAVYPSGLVRAIALCGGVPSIEAMERRDRVPSGVYSRLVMSGALVVDGGLHVPRVERLMELVMPWKPRLILGDRFRLGELNDAVKGRCKIEPRTTRWSESSFDIRGLRKLAKDGPLSVERRSRDLLKASLSVAAVRHDDAGSVRMIKSGTNGCGRDDIAAALTLAAGAAARSAPSNKPVELRLLGEPGTSGTADIDKLFELREDKFQLVQLEQVTAGVDVQGDRLVFVVLGFSPGNTDCWVLDYGVVLGDPREDEVWASLAAKLARPFGGLPPSVVSVDAGYLTSDVQSHCSKRRWWIPTVGRAGAGKPIARRLGPSGIATLGKDNGNSWWSGRVESGAVHLPRTIIRNEIAELCASEVLVSEGGALRWRPVDGVPNHLWDSAILSIHGRHFRTLSARRRPFGLVAV